LHNIQQQIVVEVYYECLLKLANCLHVRATNVFLTTIFKVGLLPYLILTTASTKINILIKHIETTIVCEESGHVSLSYNDLLITPEVNVVFKHVVPTIIVKSTLTYTNCGKISHSMETYMTRK
jgi:hypothetical protein